MLDGDLTDKMRLTLVNLSVGTEGDYRIRVQVTNSAGDTSMLSLTVMIRNRTARLPSSRFRITSSMPREMRHRRITAA